MKTGITVPVKSNQETPTTDCDMCGLTGLVQPRFFCGQLLTDKDLNTLLSWTQDKLRLNRYRDGWGVVCGLNICIDPENAAQVIISPGYALSGEGDDIIVPEAYKYDLSKLCQERKDPCDLSSERPEQQTLIVDLFIRYQEHTSSPQIALGREACRKVVPCEDARTNEGFFVERKVLPVDDDPVSDAAEQWAKRYLKNLGFLKRMLQLLTVLTDEKSGTLNDPKRFIDWLCEWLDKHPLCQVGCVKDDLIVLRDNLDDNVYKDDKSITERIYEWVYIIVQDVMHRYLATACVCGDPCVRLGRLWLEIDSNGRCCVAHIDTQPPYRRLLMLDHWLAPLGKINLLQAVGHRFEDARALLADLGVPTDTQRSTVTPFMHLRLLEAMLDQKDISDDEEGLVIFAKTGTEVSLIVYEQEPYPERVIGFTLSTTKVAAEQASAKTARGRRSSKK
ncbi:MAG: hypothetical protein CL607_21135 [Anaerolineaceae bacterium]|nr:hypothetical protein [Anaerolineaceae bacterium]